MAKKPKTNDQSNWRKINFANYGLGSDLPPPGSHVARIGNFDIRDTGEVIWCIITYMFRDFAETVTEWAAIAAAPNSAHRTRVADGHRILNRLAKATGRKIDVEEHEELAALFIGQDVTLLVGHKKRDGVMELTVKGVTPPKKVG